MTLGTTRRRTRGFTLIELMIVVSIILILMGVAIPNYQQSVLHAKESVLRQDLKVLRDAIDQYTLDKQKAPQSLQDLVSANYLKEIPKDPITGSNDTWETVQEDTLMAIDQQEPGIDDVHSGSQATASDGTAYNTW
ncbi:MAG TPA: prepilin-type N-terminal cleavage/methylation domain-containing protein [Terriglobales bacterium]|nr:prepilin-type N-terminal cleavage/methylation domain-containing protein [Terriglobales bacterium]